MTTDYPANLAAAVAAVQTRIPDVRKSETAKVPTKSGGSYSYSYANLAQISQAVLPLLGEVGLAWVAKPTVNGAGKFVLEYKLLHVSGESEVGEYPLTVGSPQEIGSAITYARRYCLCAVTGVAPDDDDDDGATATQGYRDRGAANSYADPWDGAQPTRPAQQQPAPAAQLPTREEVIAKAQQAIAGATLAAVEPIRAQVQTRLGEKVITDEDALDLFNAVNAREAELKKAAAAADPKVAPDVPTPDAPPAVGAGIQDVQRGRMQALFRDLDMGDRAKQMEFIRKVTRRELESRNDLTAAEAVNVIGALESQKKMGAGKKDRHLTSVNGSTS